MNKIYRCVYNESLGAWVAVSELAHARGKSSRGRLAKTILATGVAFAGAVATSSAFAVDETLTEPAYSQIIVDGNNSVTTTASPVMVGPVSSDTPQYISPDSTITSSNSTIIVANGAQFNYSSLEATNDYSKTAFELLGDGSGTLTQAQQDYLDKNATDMAKTTKGQHGELELAAVPAGVVQVVDHGTFGVVGQLAADGNTLINLADGSTLEATGTAHGIYAANQTGDVTVTIAGDINTPDRDFGATYTGYVNGDINQPMPIAVVTAGGGHGVYVDTISATGIYPEIPQAISITQQATSAIHAGGAGIKGVAGGLGTVSITQNAGAVISAGDGGIAAEGEAGDVTVAMAGTINSGGNGIHAHAGAGDVTVTLDPTAQIIAGESGIHAHTSNYKGEDGLASGNYSVVTVNTADGSSIQAAESGIHAHSGGGDVIVDNAADIVAAIVSTDGGIEYADSSTAMADISNGGRAIHAHSGGGTVTVNSSGDLLAYEDGIYAHSGGHNADGSEFVSANKVVVNTSGNITSVMGNGIRVNTAGDAEITNSANITAAFKGYVPIEGATTVNYDTGEGLELADAYAILGGAGNETVYQNGGTLIGGINLKAGDDTLIANGGKMVGDIWMEAGADTLSLKAGTDVSELSYLDGGADSDTLNIGVNLTGSSAAEPAEATYPNFPVLPGVAGNTALVGWETINVQDGATFSLSGDLNLSGDSEPVPTLMMVAPTTPGTLTIEDGSTLALAEDTQSAVITANVNNFGTIDLHQGDAAAVNTLTVNGNYAAHSDLIVDVNLATGQSDQLIINGTATGTTHVTAINGLGDVIATDNISGQLPTVLVLDPSGGGTFVGSGATSNAGEGQLILTSVAGAPQTYEWTLNTLDTNTPIYKPEVSGYTQMPYANLMLGYEMLGTLHDRVGEQQTWAWDKCGTCQETQNNQVWGRIRGNNTELTGEKRLDMEADQFVAQVGYDFDVRYNPDTGSRRHTGAMMSYGRSSIDFFDRYRAENGLLAADKYTGKGTTDAASLGLYSTYYDKNGSYLDLVGHVSYLQNEYEARNGVNVDQDGWGAGISAEVGRPYKLGNSHWLIEPQAQLSYQYISLEDFNDGRAHVDQDDQHGLRGRVGARLAYNAPTADYRTKTFYAVANVLSDFIEPSDVKIGRNVLNEDYSRTWGEVGLGLQLPIAKSAYVYADARYQQELTDEDRNGYTGTIGLKHSW